MTVFCQYPCLLNKEFSCTGHYSAAETLLRALVNHDLLHEWFD